MKKKRASGQTSVEYMLVISVVVVAVVASAYVFLPDFQQGVAELSSDVSTTLATGSVNGVGFDRGGNAGGRPNNSGGPGNGGHHGRPMSPP